MPSWKSMLLVPLLAGVLCVLATLGFQSLIRSESNEPRALLSMELRNLSPEQITAARGLIDASLREEVGSYRAMAAYLKVALPFVAAGLLALFWAVVRSHVDARTSTAEIAIREKASEEVRKLVDDKLADHVSLMEETQQLADRLWSQTVDEVKFTQVRIDGNIAYALWTANAPGQAAGYAELALKRLDEITADSEHFPKVAGIRLDQTASAAYYHADQYAQERDERAAIEASKYLPLLFKDVSDDEAGGKAAKEVTVDAILFVVSRISEVLDQRTRDVCRDMYVKYRGMIGAYLHRAVPYRAPILMASYDLSFQWPQAPIVPVDQLEISSV